MAVLVDRYDGEARLLADALANAFAASGHGTLCVSGRELAGDYRTDRDAWTWNALYRLVERSGVSGVVCLSERLGRDVDATRLGAFLARFGEPVVSVGVALDGIASVLVDERGGTREAMRHVTADGHRGRVAFVAGRPGDRRSRERVRLCRTALDELGLALEPSLSVRGGGEEEGAFHAMLSLLDEADGIDAVFVADPASAPAVARALDARGLRVPEDVALCTFGTATAAVPVSSAVRASPDEIAARASALLLERIGADGDAAPPPTSVPAAFVVRVPDGAVASPSARAERAYRVRSRARAQAEGLRAIGAATDVPSTLDAIGRWARALGVRRCYFVRHEWPYPMPYRSGTLMQLWHDGSPGEPLAEAFPTRSLLPDAHRRALAEGQLVLVPACADLDHHGYLLADPTGLDMPAFEAVAECLGGALRAQHLIGCLRDQAEMLQRSNAELQRSANHDPLTGLPNRLRFQERLRRLCDSGERGAEATLLFIDLDGFKLVNDTLGHDAGDQLLREVARRLEDVTERVRRIGGLAARLGGDEFVVLVTHAAGHDVSVDARAMLDALAAPCTIGGERVVVSASIGGSRFPHDGRNAELLLKQADRAMYQAKHAGKNGIAFYSPDLGVADGRTLRILQEMRSALPSGDIRMHFQPRVEIESGRIVGAEALMRWMTETPDGLVTRATPGEFIPLAERTGFVTELDRFALEDACRQGRAWADAGHLLVVSVNVSTNMLQQTGFAETVRATLERHALAPELLELEITESGVMTDMDTNVATLRALGSLGVRLAIDDFGKGQSSLGYLARLPVDTLKIDSSFLEPMSGGDAPPPACTAIMRAIVALGRGLGLELVAEGVENGVQHAFVEAAGCPLVQGYLHGRPMSPEALSLELEARSPLRLAS